MTGRPLNDYRRVDGDYLYPRGHDNSGLDSLRRAAVDAEIGSSTLCAATQSMFRKWEHKYGFVEGAAQILLLAGWKAT